LSLNLFFSTCFKYWSSSFSGSSSIVRMIGGSISLLSSFAQSIPLKNGCLLISFLSTTPILYLGFLFKSFYIALAHSLAYLEKILCLRRDVSRNLKLCCLNVFVEFLDVLSVVRRKSNKKFIEYSTNLVDIGCFSNSFVQKHFGS
jgi:hypothetical protein